MVKKVLASLFLLHSFYITAGCGGLNCNTSNGIRLSHWGKSNPSYPDVMIVSVNKIDTMELTIYTTNSCCGLGPVALFHAGAPLTNTILVQSSYCLEKIKLLSSPGEYKISSSNGTNYVSYSFSIHLNPVGIDEISYVEPSDFSVFPNPAKEEITLISSHDNLKQIRLLDGCGKQLSCFVVDINNYTISLLAYPPGIYFIQVATMADKIAIRKIIVL